jgi:uncharacterized protein involved in exopolysaccharide biosynthesis
MQNEPTTIERHFRRPLPGRRDVVAALFRQRRVILAAFALAVAAVLLSGVWIPKYQAHMKILVRRQRTDAFVTTYSTEPNQYSDQVTEEDLNTELELLSSDDLLREVVLKTGLAPAPKSPNDTAGQKRVAKAMLKVSKGLTIEPMHKSNVIEVRYVSRDREKTVEVLNALAAAYMEKHMHALRSAGETVFFDQEAQQYKQQLKDAQQKLLTFTQGTGIVSAPVERDSALREANDFDATARQTQTSIIETEQRIRALQAQLKTMQPRMTTVVRTSENAQLLQQLKSTLLTLELKRTELLTRYEPTYRLVQEVDRQIADTKAAIQNEENNRLRDETTDEDPAYLSVRTELTKAQDDLDGLKARAAAAASIAAQYHKSAEKLDRQALIQQDLWQTAKTQQDNYLLYAHKREEARISDALDRHRILNVAVAEQPVAPAYPNRSRFNFAVVALLLTGTFGLAAGFVADFLDPSFRTPEELRNYLGTPVLAALPKGKE